MGLQGTRAGHMKCECSFLRCEYHNAPALPQSHLLCFASFTSPAMVLSLSCTRQLVPQHNSRSPAFRAYLTLFCESHESSGRGWRLVSDRPYA